MIMPKQVFFKNLKGGGGKITLDEDHTLEFDDRGIASAPVRDKTFWKKWKRYGSHILLLEEYIAKEREKREKQMKEIEERFAAEIEEIEVKYGLIKEEEK
jgi:hypothetical protein